MTYMKIDGLIKPADPNKIEELFKSILDFCQINNKDLTEGLVYDFLRFYGLKSIDKANDNPKDISHMFEKWSKKVNNKLFGKKNIYHYLFPNSEFWGFKSRKEDSSNKEWFKIYVAVDYDHINKSVNSLINFLNSQTDFIYDMKVAKKMRSDNIVIRVKNENHVKIILEFINNNTVIQEGLNAQNPLIPNINGIGLINDLGGSYNDFMAGIVCEFLKQSNNISYGAFISFLKKVPPHWQYLNVMEKYFGYKNEHKKEEKIEAENDYVDNLTLKIESLFQASYKTLVKYEQEGLGMGFNQLKMALAQVLKNGNYSYFTNDNNVRINLYQRVLPTELISVISLSVNTIPNNDIELLLNSYVNNIYDYYKKNSNLNKLD
ncbi:MAG: hypothetical protein IJA94_00245 [Bacilli bacterium]|nr:hypothetical protein [Bacilli bacterium]